VEELKKELEAARADGRARETKWKMAANRLQKQLTSATDEIAELKRELKILDHARLADERPGRNGGAVSKETLPFRIAQAGHPTSDSGALSNPQPPSFTAAAPTKVLRDRAEAAGNLNSCARGDSLRSQPREAWGTTPQRYGSSQHPVLHASGGSPYNRGGSSASGDEDLEYWGGVDVIDGGYLRGYCDSYAEGSVDSEAADHEDDLGPSVSAYASDREGAIYESMKSAMRPKEELSGGHDRVFREHDSDHPTGLSERHQADVEARVAATEMEMAARSRGEAAEAAAAQLRDHTREHSIAVLTSIPYFEDIGEGEERPIQEDMHPDGKLERLYRSGRCEVLYATGTRKEVLPSGLQTVFFCNGDVKQTSLSRRVVYYHAEAETTHVSEPDGTQIYHFPNQQVERHFTDGLKEISFPDGTVKVILPNGEVQTVSNSRAGTKVAPARPR